MAKLVAGDFVLVNYVNPPHNVVNAVCKVIETKPWGVTFEQPTEEQGNAHYHQGPWTLGFSDTKGVRPYYPEVKVGDMVKIVGFMTSYKHGDNLPDERGVSRAVNTISKQEGHPDYYRIGSWWYPRESISLNPDAALEDAPEVPAKLVPKLERKYKCINRAKENVNGPM